MKRIGVIFGGKSGEHEVSLLSATAVIKSMDEKKYEIIKIGITTQGQWKLFTGDVDGIASGAWENQAKAMKISDLMELIDFALPILHGPYGEDGTIQGLFEMMDKPYGGCGVLGSSLCMDKVCAKEIFERNNLPTSAYHLVMAEDVADDVEAVVREVEEALPYNLFVKPSNMGSSVGISKVRNREELKEALKLAAKYDRRIIVEEAINCREVETGVIGNHDPKVAVVGEIVAKLDFYDYKAKYSDDAGTELSIPANISEETSEKIRETARKAYMALDCAGFARVDFFIDKDTGEIYINEINTIPGFTKYSMFPSLWEAAGVPFREQVERIIDLGYERYNVKNNR